jgi:serine protease Do
VVILGGNCAGVSVIMLPSATPMPTGMPTLTPTTMPSDMPTLTPTEAPTSDGTPHLHLPPIAIVTLVAPINIQPINPKLDYQAAANYGEANLSNGFSPDPYSVGMTAGGDVNVSYLGGSCSGFATSSPDLRINFGGGGAALLRIYFVGANGDASMVVNDPYGNFYCVDDSFGTVNPTIDFNNPAGGSYDIWVASYAANATVSGTLYITANSGNHP